MTRRRSPGNVPAPAELFPPPAPPAPALRRPVEEERAAAMALASLPGMTALRVRALLGHWCPTAAWEALTGARESELMAAFGPSKARVDPAVLERWRARAHQLRPESVAARCRSIGVTAVWLHGEGFPPQLTADESGPGVLFVAGDPSVLSRAQVAIIGTRRATRSGLAIAAQLAEDASAAGISVCSGLAIGIDAAAHEGALRVAGAPPVAVVGSGPDIVYPRRHRLLSDRVVAAGALVSEYPPGTSPAREFFPARNRIIAGLSRVVVIVESHATGGSLLTVEEAHQRGRTVLAVPGSIGEPASAGTNDLLRHGLACLGVADIAAAMHWSLAVPERIDPRPDPGEIGAAVLAAIGWEPHSADWVVARVGLPASAVVSALARLERGGWVEFGSGRWHRLAVAPAHLFAEGGGDMGGHP